MSVRPSTNEDILREAGKFINDKENGLSSIFRIAGNGLVNFATGLPDMASGALRTIYNGVNDRVEIPSDQKTLIGNDFASLYEKSEVVGHAVTNGTSMSVLESKSSYSTEMVGHYTNFGKDLSSDSQNYAGLNDSRKAVYEITLLSKKYANAYSDADPTRNETIAKEYAETMAKYQSVCVEKGMNWDNVLHSVSNELQLQSYEYGNLSKEIFTSRFIDGGSWDTDRVLSNRAHGMLVSYASEACPDYKDTLAPQLADKMKYEETFDVSKNAAELTFLSKIAQFGKEIFSTIKDHFFDKEDDLSVPIDVPTTNNTSSDDDYDMPC